ncbi:MAG: chorismate synthase [Candidatus Gygaella obscura]|nr:chorismate synthase [Candidatus Gygaella obscura]
MLRYLTAGESHGKCLVGILEGMPSGVKIDEKKINSELERRQSGYGRGPRMKIEFDKIEVLSGVRRLATIGSPIAMMIKNKDHSIDMLEGFSNPRPGHADLPGALKYGFSDMRNVLERASARKTAIDVAIGAICKQLISNFKISLSSRLVSAGGQNSISKIHKAIDIAKKNKDTLGGVFEVSAKGVPVGLGSYVHADRRLNAAIAASLMGIPGIKSVEFGLGIVFAEKLGSEVHDVITYAKNKGFYRKTNNAGGIEGGMSNGEDIIVRCAMKPITTLSNPLDSIDLRTKKKTKATVQRADICAIEAAGVIAEGLLAFELAKVFMEKFGSDSLVEIKNNFQSYIKKIR